MHALPVPDAAALAHSERLTQHIRAEIEAAGGWMPFARYMELALYAPGLGYYSAGAGKFGQSGDFVTAPELTALFGRALARQVAQVLDATAGDILELGPGSGRLALDLMQELERLGRLPGCYALLEVSADLRERQEDLFRRKASHLLPRMRWLQTLPQNHHGLILGNEVLDALPVHLLHWTRDGLQERGVAWHDGFRWQDRPLTEAALRSAAAGLPAPEGDYLSEIGLAQQALVRSLAAFLERGVVLLLDYGFPRAEYYHAQRHQGTLMCHYRHHAHADPFSYPGLTDITAHVDFSAVAEAGIEAGLELLGYTGQAQFLMNCGLLALLGELRPGTPDYFRAAAAAQKLLQPSEMGELFKVIALGRGMDGSLLGFDRGDRSGRL